MIKEPDLKYHHKLMKILEIELANMCHMDPCGVLLYSVK